ncbi:MAG: tol-pal system protein YbgF [Persephonella sp.]|nr:MAG: tol-pal system protein YbgF [Persephonella sp.]
MKKFLLALPIGVIILSSCANTNRDIAILNKKIWQLKKEVRALHQEHKEIKADLQELSSRTDNVAQMASQNSVEIEKLKMKINSLSSKVGTANKTSSYSYSSIPDYQSDQVSTSVATTLSEEDLYRQALDAYRQQDFDRARKLFLELVQKYPYSKYYDNALFWVGQTYYREGKYDKAIEYFDRIINECDAGTSPDCNKMPMALLKKAYSLIYLGEKNKAKTLLERIIREYPDSEAYDLAKRKLETLNY